MTFAEHDVHPGRLPPLAGEVPPKSLLDQLPPDRHDTQRPLRIAIVVETFAKQMGYVSNTLPKYLARQGHVVHIVTTEKLPYVRTGSGEELFGSAFADKNRNRIGTHPIDGYTVHTLPSRLTFGYWRLQGLAEKLAELSPDVVCIFVSVGWIALDCARLARPLGYQLIVGNHTGKTVFPLARRPTRWYQPARLKCTLLRGLPGHFVDAVAHHCVVPTTDCADVASRFFGIAARKVRIMNLPVDTDHFHPVASAADGAERVELRQSLGLAHDEIVCVYSGKFTQAKNPAVLLRAVEHLAAKGHRVRALFVGEGEQQAALSGHPLARVLPFKPFNELGRYFRGADIGVWMEESISYLDAASCGLPLVLGSTVNDTSHLTEFVSAFEANDPASLAAAITPLFDPQRRSEISRSAATLSAERFSASRYAQKRVAYFREALST
jgi:glycosyltransferase involved in cell wall biosynthesis